MQTKIETSRLVLRPFQPSDVEAAFTWFGDPMVMRFTVTMTCRNMAGSYSRTFSPRQSSDHAEDEIANFLGGRSSSNRSPGLGNQLPIQAKPGSVPTDDCFRGDQDEPLPPTRPQAPSNYPEESVEVSEAWAPMVPPQHSQLLTQ